MEATWIKAKSDPTVPEAEIGKINFADCTLVTFGPNNKLAMVKDNVIDAVLLAVILNNLFNKTTS